MVALTTKAAAVATAAGLLVLAAIGGACGGKVGDDGRTEAIAPASPDDGGVIHASRSQVDSIQALRAPAVAVVRFRVEAERTVEMVGDAPFTVSVATTLDVVEGEFPLERFHLRQLGTDKLRVEDGLPLVRHGQEYVALLAQVEDQVPGQKVRPQFTPVYSTGLFAAAGDRLTHLDPVDDAVPQLPRELTIQQLVQLWRPR